MNLCFFVFFFAFCVMYSLSGSLDTKRSHVTLSLHAWVHARSPLEFCHQADVVARPLRVRQAAVLGANFALARQLEHAHRCKGIFCVEDVIQGAVEVLRAVREQGLTDHVDAVALALERVRIQARFVQVGVRGHERKRMRQFGNFRLKLNQFEYRNGYTICL